MPCYQPNMMAQSWNPITQKWMNGKYVNAKGPNFKGYEWYEKFNANPEMTQNGMYRWVRTNCRECIGCSEAYAKEWACRSVLEAEYHKESYFVTLTYSDKYLPITNIFTYDGKTYYDDGTWGGYLDYKAANKFIRAVRDWQRREFGITGIKFFGCGEYGDERNTERPHFHIIFFGLHIPPEEVKVHSIRNGEILYECPKLASFWVNDHKHQIEPNGFVSVAECNYQTCRYVAGYVQKKRNKFLLANVNYNKLQYYASKGQTPEKTFVSTHPGIGKAYFNEHAQEFFIDDYILIKGAKKKIVAARIPKTFDRWIEGEAPGAMAIRKEQRKKAALKAQNIKMSMTSLSIAEQLKIEEANKEAKMLIFKYRDGKR